NRSDVVEGTRASLHRLDIKYVDVIYWHCPRRGHAIEETVRALNHIIDRGWAFYRGTSEWSAHQITEAWGVANRLDLVGPIVELVFRREVEVEYLPLYSTYGLGLTTWSPLASGVLTGKYSKGNIPPDGRFALENYKIKENMKALDVIPLWTPGVIEKIEAVVQTKPKHPELYRTRNQRCVVDGILLMVGLLIFTNETIS
uniref:Probable voltage-gated potassium channel subunit beta n=1 Tax=Elaeis guineensis var. tenera TaxID=51953 RepID=A0A6I9QLS8_ELAGV